MVQASDPGCFLDAPQVFCISFTSRKPRGRPRIRWTDRVSWLTWKGFVVQQIGTGGGGWEKGALLRLFPKEPRPEYWIRARKWMDGKSCTKTHMSIKVFKLNSNCQKRQMASFLLQLLLPLWNPEVITLNHHQYQHRSDSIDNGRAVISSFRRCVCVCAHLNRVRVSLQQQDDQRWASLVNTLIGGEYWWAWCSEVGSYRFMEVL